jgi:hypothetical protein
MATETQRVSATVAGGAGSVTNVDVYPPKSTFFNTATSQKFLVNGVEQALTGYSVLDAAVKPAEYDTLEVIMGWSDKSGTVAVTPSVQTSSDGVYWVNHTTATGAVSANGMTRLSVTNFAKFIRLALVNGAAGTIVCTADFTYKKKVA